MNTGTDKVHIFLFLYPSNPIAASIVTSSSIRSQNRSVF